jgi:hypothetical protein
MVGIAKTSRRQLWALLLFVVEIVISILGCHTVGPYPVVYAGSKLAKSRDIALAGRFFDAR